MSIISRTSLDSSLILFSVIALLAAIVTAYRARVPHQPASLGSQDFAELAGVSAGAFFLTALFTGHVVNLIPALSLFLGVGAAMFWLADRLSTRGTIWNAAHISALIVAPVWGWRFIAEADLPPWFETAALTGLGLSLLAAAVGLAASLAREAILTHERWRQPFAAPPAPLPARERMVSLHLPCYAEPPEMVKETMNHLADLDYRNFEVLVCDNNTKDERLWKPLEQHCRALNRRLGREVFRFLHVAPLPGAKAGALNLCLERMAPDAEIVGVVDADYFSRRDFLARLVPFFDDPRIGYVQTPHDYRAYGESNYLAACYWEYMPCNKVDWPGISEYGGAFTIGTMCLLRAEALRRVGGWAEWCLTEDSEVSVRLRAAGYRGLYFVETFGRGLIPETYDDYKKQRFRWTAGPVQQLRRHWRLFLPAPFAPLMPGWTKLLEVTRCTAPLMRLAALLMALAGVTALGVAAAIGVAHPVDVPNVVWMLLLLGGLTWTVRTAHRYRLSGCTDVNDMIRGEVARASLSYVVLIAGVAGLSSRPLAWRRTPKFAVETAEDSPFDTTFAETVAGSVLAALALLVMAGAGFWGHEIAILAALGLAATAAGFFCAPLMAAMSIRHTLQAESDKRPSAAVLPARPARDPAKPIARIAGMRPANDAVVVLTRDAVPPAAQPRAPDERFPLAKKA